MKPVKFKLNGKQKSLYYDWNTLSEFEEQFDISIPYAVQEKRLGFGSIRNLIWAGLLHEEPELDVKEVGNRLQKDVQAGEHSLMTLGEPVMKALKASGVLDVSMGDNPKGEPTSNTSKK